MDYKVEESSDEEQTWGNLWLNPGLKSGTWVNPTTNPTMFGLAVFQPDLTFTKLNATR